MDQHPIPQDVTGFQFKLVGTMTVKQFGYVAAGVITGFALYYVPLSTNATINLLLKIIFIPFFGASGFIIAFVPIEGRPIDVMTTNFVKALLSPNRYVYRKQGRQLSFLTITLAPPPAAPAAGKQAAPSMQAQKVAERKEKKLQELLMRSNGRVKNKEDEKEMALLRSFANMAGASTTPLPVTPSTSSGSTTPSTGHPTVNIPNSSGSVTTSTGHPTVSIPNGSGSTTPSTAPKTPVAAHMPSATIVQQVQQPINVPVALPNTSTVAPVPTATQTPQSKETPDGLSQQEKTLEQELAAAKQAEAQQQTPAAATAAHQKVAELQKHIEEVHMQKQHLEQELIKLKAQLAPQQVVTAPSATPAVLSASPVMAAPIPSSPSTTVIQAAPTTMPQPQPQQDTQHTRAIPQDMMKKIGLPHTSDTPNVVVGIVKDPRGNVLPNILVEIKDKDSNPVRAFKTNTLGQFASATPLSYGIYTMELEDPKKQHTFDVIQIAASNQILLPIEIISHDAREALRQQLFN